MLIIKGDHFVQKNGAIRLRLSNVTKCIFLILLLSACTTRDIYYNKDFNPPVYFGTHIVQQDETLYNIAWRYGRDYKELASANNIKSPFILSVGQRIDLEVDQQSYKAQRSSNKKEPSTSPNVTGRKQNPKLRNKTTRTKKSSNSNKITWGWPHVGLILAKYSVNSRSRDINKGIDIRGVGGDEIRAAASGEVVYAGNGLLGYGNLIIINHSDRYLSAYGHNQDMLVKEGDRVKRGQQIATMGAKGGKPMLHFEIRKDGQPVNPAKYLPHK